MTTARLLTALGCVLVAAAGPVAAQSPVAPQILAAAKAAVVLVECGAAPQQTYRTGLAVQSDGVNSVVVTAHYYTSCSPAQVYLDGNLAHGYPATPVPIDPERAVAASAFTADTFLVLSVSHPSRQVGRLVAGTLASSQPYVLVGFPTGTGTAPDVRPSAVLVDRGTTGTPRGYEINAPAALGVGGVLFDPANGNALGLTTAFMPGSLGGPGPSTLPYTIADTGRLLATLGVSKPQIVPGLTRLDPAQIQARTQVATLTANVGRSTFVVMRRGLDESQPTVYSPAALATIVGTNGASTILAAPIGTYLKKADFSTYALAVPDAAGRTQKVAPTLIATDAQRNIWYLSIPKIDVPAPAFAAAALNVSLPAAIVRWGNCKWLSTVFSLAPCPLAVSPATLTNRPAAGELGVSTADTGGASSQGSPIIDTTTGKIVGVVVNPNVAVTTAVLATSLAENHVGIALTLR